MRRFFDSIAFPCLSLAVISLVIIASAFYFVGTVSTVPQALAQVAVSCLVLFGSLVPLTEERIIR